jgi:acetyltransferase
MRQATGRELIIGGRRDSTFGPIVLVGLGGILAEAVDDVALCLAPVQPADAAAMLDGLRAAAVLGPIRGRPGIDRETVIAAIIDLGDALVADASLLEIDVNPLMSGPDGTVAVDALVVVSEPAT